MRFVTVIRFRDGTHIVGTLVEDGIGASADAAESATLTTRTDVTAIEVWRGEFRPYQSFPVRPVAE